MSNSPPPNLYDSRQKSWGNPHAAESNDGSQADVTASATPVASSNEATAVVAAAAAVAAVAATVRCAARVGGAKTLKLFHLKCFFYRSMLAYVHLSNA